MKTSNIAVVAINIQSDSIVRQTNKVNFLTEKILYQTTPELHQTMLKNFSYVQHPASHQTIPDFIKLHQLTPNTTNYTKQHKTTQTTQNTNYEKLQLDYHLNYSVLD